MKLVYGEKLSTTLFCFVQLFHEVPEPRFGQHNVLRKKPHAENLWRRVLRSRSSTAHDLVLVHARRQRWIHSKFPHV